jgi:hypothetical protein
MNENRREMPADERRLRPSTTNENGEQVHSISRGEPAEETTKFKGRSVKGQISIPRLTHFYFLQLMLLMFIIH